jgi:hypothetical protein
VIVRLQMTAWHLVCLIRGHDPSMRLAVQQAHRVTTIRMPCCKRCGRDVEATKGKRP